MISESECMSEESYTITRVDVSGDRLVDICQPKKTLSRITSFRSMLTPATSKLGSALERSFSFNVRTSSSPVACRRPISSYRRPGPALADRRQSKFWCETVDYGTRMALTRNDTKRQEAIYELVQGEKDLIDDLTMVIKLYCNSMRKLSLMTDEELDQIFGIVERLVPIHQDLLRTLKSLEKDDGTTDCIGAALLKWVPNLCQYETYCANQVYAKSLLDSNKNNPRVEDFLLRCQESSFSRKLDLWNFLDLPRTRLVKYPLLIKQILKYTSESHDDYQNLVLTIKNIEKIIKDVDKRMGESKCRHAIESLEYTSDSAASRLIGQCVSLVCEGPLKNDKGMKVHLFLFDKVLVVTRPFTSNNRLKYQIHKYPIPLSELRLNDLPEHEGRLGSFRNRLLRQIPTDKYAFQIGGAGDSGHHTLLARDEHDKRQWINCIGNALESHANCQPLPRHTAVSGLQAVS